MREFILTNIIIHKRFIPFKHTLKYNIPSLYLNLDEELVSNLNIDELQKIVMTRTATLPVQSR